MVAPFRGLSCLHVRAFVAFRLPRPPRPAVHAAVVPAQAPKKPSLRPATTIVWRGDIVSARGFVNDLVKEYRKEHNGLLTVQTFSTISGLDGVRAGTADIAGVARPMHEKREEERNLVFQPVALDAIVPLVHPRNPVSNLTLAQMRQIYLGRISNWKDLGGPDVPINSIRSPRSLDGVEYSFRRLMYKRGEQRSRAAPLSQHQQARGGDRHRSGRLPVDAVEQLRQQGRGR